jgi:NhaA family Na+:H+ antiporter
VLHTGVHATIAGVVLGLLTPTRARLGPNGYSEVAEKLFADVQRAGRSGASAAAEGALGQIEELTVATEAPADRLLRLLHPWSSYAVLPLFALANAGIPLTAETARQALSSSPMLGAFMGLLLGKVAGIVLFAGLAVRLRIAQLLPGVRWLHLAGVGLLAGIGFTVSLFITDLAFDDSAVNAQAKLGVLSASLLAGIAGYLLLRWTARRSPGPA